MTAHRPASGAALSIAPMMDYTDRHFRFFFRHLTKRTLLYTEMITAEAILRGDRKHLLDFDPLEHPVSLQLGGGEAKSLAAAAKIGEEWGYDEINLNVGCPSDRVQGGRFGACLMAEPSHVADLLASMQAAVTIPVTVKHRIGIDHLESYNFLHHFVDTVAKAGVRRFTIHARIALLNGLSPKENRTVPPLRYPDVYRLKKERPDLFIEINGGIVSLQEVESHRTFVDAAMIGRAAVDEPFLFAQADHRIFGEPPSSIRREDVIRSMFPTIEAWQAQGLPLHRLLRHFLGLWKGLPGARHWRRFLNESAQGNLDFKAFREGFETFLLRFPSSPSSE